MVQKVPRRLRRRDLLKFLTTIPFASLITGKEPESNKKRTCPFYYTYVPCSSVIGISIERFLLQEYSSTIAVPIFYAKLQGTHGEVFFRQIAGMDRGYFQLGFYDYNWAQDEIRPFMERTARAFAKEHTLAEVVEAFGRPNYRSLAFAVQNNVCMTVESSNGNQLC